jgi:hypothetical protein
MRAALCLLAPCALAACLPNDTRPPPAEVTVTVSSSPLTLSGIPSTLTADGFDISIDRFVVNLGEAELGANDTTGCNEYSNPTYTRLFDFTHVTAPTELGLAFAIGRCQFGYDAHFPDELTLLGQGVTSTDEDFMRTPGDDPDAMNAGVVVYVEGVGVRGDQVEHFAWPFRKRVTYTDCQPADADATGDDLLGLDLASGEKTGVNIEIQAEALFGGSPTTLAHFEPFALADANGDGEITFDELWTVPLSSLVGSGLELSPANAPSDPSDPSAITCWTKDSEPIELQTLGDYAYCKLVPAVTRYRGTGLCTIESGRPPNGD